MMKVFMKMGGKLHEVGVAVHHRRGDGFTSVRATCGGTCQDFNELFCCMVALDLLGKFAPLKLHITNNFTHPGFNGVWLERKFRSHKVANEFVRATPNRIDSYVQHVKACA